MVPVSTIGTSADVLSGSSRYLTWHDDALVTASGGKPASTAAKFVHGQLRELILGGDFPCVGARSALNRGTYRFGLYTPLGSPSASRAVADDLVQFVADQPLLPGNFTTFIASFDGPNPRDEAHFEELLWQQLQVLHDLDDAAWDPTVSSNPDDPHFSFSFAGRAFFLVGLHAGSSRWARRFTWPTLVFNAHYQFERLREEGHFDRFKSVIQTRDRMLQGGTNPNLSDYGDLSEARQYAGRHVEPTWSCPFRVYKNERNNSCNS